MTVHERVSTVHFAIAGRALTFALAVLILAGCGAQATDKAGGEANTEQRELTVVVSTGATSQTDAFARVVRDGSEGDLSLAYRSSAHMNQPDFESRLIRDVAAGRIDMAVVGARAFDRVGVTSFQPLLAPLLVDSYALQRALFDAGIPQRMLAGVEKAGVVGIAVLPGPMRKLLGVTRGFRAPEDFRGRVVGLQDSALGEATLEVLGARPQAAPPEAGLNGLDGYEQQLEAIAGNQYDRRANSVTANLNLWPRPSVVIMSREAHGALDDRQRAALAAAAKAVVAPAFAETSKDDAEAMTVLCNRGIDFVQADLATLRAAVAGVAPEGQVLTEIEDLKTELAAPPESPVCGDSGHTGAPSASPLDGRYEFTTTKAELGRVVPPRDIVTENYGEHRWTLADGRFRMEQRNGRTSDNWTTGTFTVRDDLLILTIGDAGGQAPNGALAAAGEVWTYRWSLYRDQLTLRAVPGEISPEPYRVKPWRRRG